MHAMIGTSVILGLFLGLLPLPAHARENTESLKGTVALSGAWALYPMAVKWAEVFREIHPGVRIDIGAGGAGKGMADCLTGTVDIGMVSRDIYPEEIKKGAWWIAVAKDAVVPTMNASNPLAAEILARGISREIFTGMWITGDITTWEQAAGADGNGKHDIHVYTRSDACGAAKTWAKYLGWNQEDLLDVGVYGDPGLATAVINDQLGAGFNNINYAYDAKTKITVSGIRILPIDLNENGRLDKDEDFYGDRDQIVAAIADGRYPSPPARDLFFVSRGCPEKPAVRAFIQWVLTEGQGYVQESGYIPVPQDKLREGLNRLRQETLAGTCTGGFASLWSE